MKRTLAFLLCCIPVMALGAGSDWATRLLDSRGPGAALENPALLGNIHLSRWAVELPGGGAAVSNNSFSVGYWNSHIAGDDYWSSSETQEILHRIPASGLNMGLDMAMPLVGVRWREFAFNARILGGGRADVPKSVAELALVGTKLNENYSVSDLMGQSVLVSDVSVGWGHTLRQDIVPEAAAGIAVHYLAGLMYTDARSVSANLYSSDELLQGSGSFKTITAMGGSGLGVDLGLAATINPRWKAGLTVQGIGASMKWRVHETSTSSFETDAAGLNLDSLDSEGYTDRVFASQDTTVDGGNTTMHLPMIVRASAEFLAAPRWTVAGVMNGILNDTPWGKSGIELGTAAVWRPIHWGVVQGGILAGGPHRALFTLGGGLRFRAYEMDLSFSSAGGLFNSSHGAGASLSQRIFF